MNGTMLISESAGLGWICFSWGHRCSSQKLFAPGVDGYQISASSDQETRKTGRRSLIQWHRQWFLLSVICSLLLSVQSASK